MEERYSKKIIDILKVGRYLGSAGTDNWALNKDEAINALIKFERLQIPILGGDVCKIINEEREKFRYPCDEIIEENIKNFYYTQDSWYYEKINGESYLEYVSNSIKKDSGRLYLQPS